MSGDGYVARLSRAACVGCLVGFAASAAYAIEPRSTAAANAGECLSRPKGPAPQGERWYYRVERNTKRHCWYTRSAAAPRVAAAQKLVPPEPVVSSNAPEATQEPLLPTVAEARAEADITPAPPQKPIAAPAPREVLSDAESNRLTGTLANRWPGHEPADPVAAPAAKATPPKIAPAPPAPAPEPISADGDNDGIWIVVGLAGIAAALTALGMPRIVALLRRRRQLHMSSWDAAETRK